MEELIIFPILEQILKWSTLKKKLKGSFELSDFKFKEAQK